MGAVWIVLSQGIGVLICFAIPVAGFFILHKRYPRILRPMAVGMLCFFVSQILCRLLPLQIILPKMLWYHAMEQTQPGWHLLFLGVTAGLFEEIGRFMFIRFMLKGRREYKDALAFGVGHAGLEAMLIVGVSALFSFVYLIIQNVTGAVPVEVHNVIMGITATDGLLLGLERLLVTTLHIGWTVLIMEGINNKKPLAAVTVAVFSHALIDTLISMMHYSWGWNIWIVEGMLLICSGVAIGYTVRAKKRFAEQGKD